MMLTIAGFGPMGLKVNKPRMFGDNLGCKVSYYAVKGHVPCTLAWDQPYGNILPGTVHGLKRGSIPIVYGLYSLQVDIVKFTAYFIRVCKAGIFAIISMKNIVTIMLFLPR